MAEVTDEDRRNLQRAYEEQYGAPPQQPYTHRWDLSTVPTDLILAEAGRRRNAQRKTKRGGTNGGRPKRELCGICKGVHAQRDCPSLGIHHAT